MSCSCRCSDEVVCKSVLPIELCLKLVRDATTSFGFVLLDEEGNPIDVTSDDIRLNIYDEIGGSIKLSKSATKLDAANGKIEFTINSGDLPALTEVETVWVYEIRRTSVTDNEVHYQGDFKIYLAPAG
jgi:hypothetical protein